MDKSKSILVIEDEQDLARIICNYMQSKGYLTYQAQDAASGLHAVESKHPDFIILDLSLPDRDGIEVCRMIRNHSDSPILILSARGSDTDKVMALGFGADDYMVKPFSFTELTARIEAHLRRRKQVQRQPDLNEQLRFSGLMIDKAARSVVLEQQNVHLSAKEFDLLYFMASHPHQVFSKTQLLDHVWGTSSYVDDNTVTVYVGRLRDKLESHSDKPMYIKTVWGVGYKFSPDEKQASR